MRQFDLDGCLDGAYSHYPEAVRKPLIGLTGNFADGEARLVERYYKSVAEAGGVPVIVPPLADKDGFTPEQRFFLAYANLWAGNIRDEEIRNLTKSDPHSLGRWRVNGALPHIDAWYEAFGITEQDSMFVPQSERARIW